VSDYGNAATLHLELGVALSVIAAILCATTVLLITNGFGWETLNLPLRVTARISVVLFALAFATHGVSRLRNWQAPAALAFAACHFIHLGLIITRARVGNHFSMLADPQGVIAYAAIAFIAWRAFTYRPERSSSRRMQFAESAAYWMVWITFAYFLVNNFLSAEAPRPLIYPALVGLLIVAAAVRVGWRFLERAKISPLTP
jgi:hypothetical protein